jgi:hypothetical protein
VYVPAQSNDLVRKATMADTLNRLELELLHSIPKRARDNTKAYVVWDGWEGIEMGPVRWAAEFLSGRRYSCSPFPGTWVWVEESKILRVRHVEALSIVK